MNGKNWAEDAAENVLLNMPCAHLFHQSCFDLRIRNAPQKDPVLDKIDAALRATESGQLATILEEGEDGVDTRMTCPHPGCLHYLDNLHVRTVHIRISHTSLHAIIEDGDDVQRLVTLTDALRRQLTEAQKEVITKTTDLAAAKNRVQVAEAATKVIQADFNDLIHRIKSKWPDFEFHQRRPEGVKPRKSATTQTMDKSHEPGPSPMSIDLTEEDKIEETTSTGYIDTAAAVPEAAITNRPVRLSARDPRGEVARRQQRVTVQARQIKRPLRLTDEEEILNARKKRMCATVPRMTPTYMFPLTRCGLSVMGFEPASAAGQTAYFAAEYMILGDGYAQGILFASLNGRPQAIEFNKSRIYPRRANTRTLTEWVRSQTTLPKKVLISSGNWDVRDPTMSWDEIEAATADLHQALFGRGVKDVIALPVIIHEEMSTNGTRMNSYLRGQEHEPRLHWRFRYASAILPTLAQLNAPKVVNNEVRHEIRDLRLLAKKVLEIVKKY